MLSDLAIPFIFFNPCDVLNNLIDMYTNIYTAFQWSLMDKI